MCEPPPRVLRCIVSDLKTCPFCGSHQLFPGTIKSGTPHLFEPQDSRVPELHFAAAEGIHFDPHAELCAHCGLLWAHADPEKARSFIEAYGSPEAIAILSESTVAAVPTTVTPPGPAHT